MTAPGWYPDGQGNQRYWDGQGWTAQTAPSPATAPPPPPYGQPVPGGPVKKSHKTRNIVLGVVAAIIVISAIASTAGGSKKKNDNAGGSSASNTVTSSGASSTTPTSPKVSVGVGSNKAIQDVVLAAPEKDPTLGTSSVKVTTTNHSSKRSDYFITVALETADGKTQIDTATIFVENLEPGQSNVQNGEFLQTLTTPAPDGAKAVLQEVQRTEST